MTEDTLPKFGIDLRPVVDPLVDAITPAGAELDLRVERFARIAWSHIAEPGDADANRVIAALGADRALTELIDNGNPRYIAALMQVTAGVEVDEDTIQGALNRWLPRVSLPEVLRGLRQAARVGAVAVIPGDKAWPEGFADLGEHAPYVLYVRGNYAVLSDLDKSVAIVGARAATGYGEHVTVEMSSDLVDRGYTIISGAAYGIDGAAHRAALASRGTTVAFLAGGLDRFYPSGHEALLTRIVETGAAVSEVPCGTPPTKWRFLQRNRLIAAAATATVVVEAGYRSGSLNTAGHAQALGRPLGAVPGPITSSASAGCHRLLREFDAVAVTTADEIVELTRGGRPRPQNPILNNVDPEGAE